MTNSCHSLGVSRAGRAALATLSSLAALVAVLLVSGRAMASSYTLKTPEVTESGGQWHIKVRIDLSRPPAMMHTPMRFTFSKEAVDERAIMSKGADPVHHRIVLDDVAEADQSDSTSTSPTRAARSSSRRTSSSTSRATDGYFEAGEYQVTLSGADGDVGSAQKLVLKGDNPPVYRGAMDFASDPKAGKKKGPKIESVSTGLDGGDQVAQNDDARVRGALVDRRGSGRPGAGHGPEGRLQQARRKKRR